MRPAKERAWEAAARLSHQKTSAGRVQRWLLGDEITNTWNKDGFGVGRGNPHVWVYGWASPPGSTGMAGAWEKQMVIVILWLL